MTVQNHPALTHGGPDALGVPLYDFSTNSNACGPCPHALVAVQQADATRYPDPQYTALKAELAAFHNVNPTRIVLAASASEFIHRISAWVARSGRMSGGCGDSEDGNDNDNGGMTSVCFPQHHYGDYAQAAQAWGLPVTADPSRATLLWCCEPSSPLGQPQADMAAWVDSVRPHQQAVLDCAYAPLRLSGTPSLNAAQMNAVWQLWTPNKALGLTGIRAAYAIAPQGVEPAVRALTALSPSWPIGAHGVALLYAWCRAPSQQWLTRTLPILRAWKAQQVAQCTSWGWQVLPSEANFFVARPGVGDFPAWLHTLRNHGIKLRDATSFGLPGHVRLGVLPPQALEQVFQHTPC